MSKKCSMWTLGSLSFNETSTTMMVTGAGLAICRASPSSNEADGGLFLKSSSTWMVWVGFYFLAITTISGSFWRKEKVLEAKVYEGERMQRVCRRLIVKGQGDLWWWRLSVLGKKRENEGVCWNKVGFFFYKKKYLTHFKWLSIKTLKILCFIKLASSGHSPYDGCICIMHMYLLSSLSNRFFGRLVVCCELPRRFENSFHREHTKLFS